MPAVAVAAGLGAVGTYLGARENRRATQAATRAAQFQPFNVHAGGVGSLRVANGSVVMDPSSAATRRFNRMVGTGTSAFNQGLRGLNRIDTTFDMGRRIDPRQQIQRALRESGLVPAATRGLQKLFDSINPNSINTSAMSGLINENNALRAQGREVVDASMLNMGNAMEQAGLQGQLGTNFLNQLGSTDINVLAQQQMERLNSLATPFEDREAAGLADRLFGSGRGGTTGGAQQFGDLIQAQERASTERALAAMGFATGEQNRLAELGMGLVAGGQQTALQGMGGAQAAQGSLAGLIGLGADLRMNTANLQGMRANLVGMKAGIQGQMFNQLLGAQQFGLQSGMAQSDFLLNQNAQRFNQQMGMAQLQQAIAAQQMQGGLGMIGASAAFDPFQQMMQMGQLSQGLSATAAGAGANVGSFAMQGGQNRANMITGAFGGLMNAIPSYATPPIAPVGGAGSWNLGGGGGTWAGLTPQEAGRAAFGNSWMG